MTKICKKCGIEKSITEFTKDKRKKDGLDIYCKDCNKERKAKHYAEHQENILCAHTKYNEENAEKVKESKAKSYKKHKEKVDEKSAKYYEENKEDRLEKQAKYDKEHKEERNERIRNKKKTDPLYKLSDNIRTLIRGSIKKAVSKNPLKPQIFLAVRLKNSNNTSKNNFLMV